MMVIEMSNEFFPSAVDPAQQRRGGVMAVPGRAVNSVEIEIRELMQLEPETAPLIIWLDGDEAGEDGIWTNRAEWESWFGGPLTLAEAMKLSDIERGKLAEKYRHHLLLTRDLGPSGTVELYRVSCECAGIVPLL